LTLQVNETAGASPSVSYTKFFRNAFNFDAGSSSLTSNVIQSVAQSFTLGVGGGLSEQAQRSDVVTFSLSLKELKVWRKRLRSTAARLGTFSDELACGSSGRELRGNLGLREWIDSALYPVQTLELRAGEHPSPVSGPSKTPGASAPSRLKAAADSISLAEAKERVGQAETEANTSVTNATASQQAIAHW
jgi:hypothetical protein